MKAYLIVEKDKKIEPFGEHPRQCLIGNKKLCDHQRETLLNLGIGYNIVRDLSGPELQEERIAFSESLYFTPEFLARFIAKARLLRGPVMCGMKKGVTTLRTAVNLQDTQDHGEYIEIPLRYFPSNSSKNPHVSFAIVDCDQFDCRVPVPEHMCGDCNGYAVPMTDTFAVQINHWVNLWVVNVLFALANVARIRKTSMVKLVPWKIFRNLNRKGKDCKIHKSAVVEASVIGNNVTIEAGAIVRASIVGDNVHIGNGVIVEESVLGAGCKILHGHILFSALLPGTFSVNQIISASLLGKDVFVSGYTPLADFRFDGENISVLVGGKRVDTGNRFLGCCLGNNVYLGPGCVVAPGRTVPNGSQVCLKEGVFKGSENDEGIQVIKR